MIIPIPRQLGCQALVGYWNKADGWCGFSGSAGNGTKPIEAMITDSCRLEVIIIIITAVNFALVAAQLAAVDGSTRLRIIAIAQSLSRTSFPGRG